MASLHSLGCTFDFQYAVAWQTPPLPALTTRWDSTALAHTAWHAFAMGMETHHVGCMHLRVLHFRSVAPTHIAAGSSMFRIQGPWGRPKRGQERLAVHAVVHRVAQRLWAVRSAQQHNFAGIECRTDVSRDARQAV